MKDKLKAFLASEKGMAVINVLFFLALIGRNTGFIFIAYLAWAAYLVFCLRRAPSKALRIVYGVLLAFDACMLAANFFFLWKRL
jgi:hypothetical protein